MLLIEIVNIVNFIINEEIKLPDGHHLRVSRGVSLLHSEVVTCVLLFYDAVSDQGPVWVRVKNQIFFVYFQVLPE